MRSSSIRKLILVGLGGEDDEESDGDEFEYSRDDDDDDEVDREEEGESRVEGDCGLKLFSRKEALAAAAAATLWMDFGDKIQLSGLRYCCWGVLAAGIGKLRLADEPLRHTSAAS